MKKNLFLLSTIALLIFSACDDDDMPMINEPATYSFERENTSTVSFSGQTTRILMAEELISELVEFSQTTENLMEMFVNETINGADANPFSNADLNESTKSIRSKVAASSDYFSSNTVGAAAIKTDFDEWLNKQVAITFPAENTAAEAGVAGQIADGSNTRWINAQGLEYNQVFAKSLIGALMTDQMLNNYLSPAVLDAETNITDNDAEITVTSEAYTNMEHKWDEAYGYLFGTASDFKDPLQTVGDDDNFLNKYLGRVNDDSDFEGIASDIFNAFKRGRAAIVAGEYNERDIQAEIIQEEVSKIIAIRAVYYMQTGKTAFGLNEQGTAFHALSEGYGFIYGLQFTRKPSTGAPYFSNTEVEAMLADLMGDGINGLWDVTDETLDQISQTIADAFGFTVEQAAE